MKNLYFLVVLIIAVSSQNVLSQSIKPQLSKEEKVQEASLDSIRARLVIYGKKKDGLPQTIKIRGVIEEVNIAFFGCGIIHWNGTAKIRVLNKVEGYKPEYVYIVASCFFTSNKEILNRVVEIELSKLRKGKMPGGAIFNTIDSSGVAFYRLNKIQSLK